MSGLTIGFIGTVLGGLFVFMLSLFGYRRRTHDSETMPEIPVWHDEVPEIHRAERRRDLEDKLKDPMPNLEDHEAELVRLRTLEEALEEELNR